MSKPEPIVMNMGSVVPRCKAEEMSFALEEAPTTWSRVFHFMTDGMMLTSFNNGRMFVFSDSSMLIDSFADGKKFFPTLELATQWLETTRAQGNPLSTEILVEAKRRTAMMMQHQAEYMEHMEQHKNGQG
jgi:hypothetical protein